MIPSSKQPVINLYIQESFRDMADKDYIAARIAYRYGLEYPFLWLALQAIEKYLKAILLYNGRSIKNIKKSGHSILDAFDKVYEISDIPFNFPKNIRPFIEYLDEQGTNRYFEYPYYTFGKELLFLDRTVWHIRRYCFYLRGTLHNPGGEPIDLFPLNLKKFQHPNTLKYPNRFRIPGSGFLEEVLGKRTEIRQQLVWKNFYYGTYRKNVIKDYRLRRVAGNPTHFRHPDIFPELDKIVKFSKPLREYFKKKGVI